MWRSGVLCSFELEVLEGNMKTGQVRSLPQEVGSFGEDPKYRTKIKGFEIGAAEKRQ